MNRDNYATIANMTNINIPFIEDWMVGQLIKTIHEPYNYSNIHSLVMSLPYGYKKQALDIIKYLDSHDYIYVDRIDLKTYETMDSRHNIIVYIKEKLRNILNNI